MKNIYLKTKDNEVINKLFSKKDIITLEELIYELERLYFENQTMAEKLPDSTLEEIEEQIEDNYEDYKLGLL